MTAASQTPQKPSRRGWQFSLRALVLLTLVLGATLGLAGPLVVECLQQWSPAGRGPLRPLPVRGAEGFESNGYFESAETPL